MIVTPDYGLSDIWHFNYPLKNLLSQSLKQGKLPLWTDMVGNGFPIGAEGQIGIFSPLNWIIFGLLPMPTAFTVALTVSFILLFVGGYLFSRSLGLSRPAGVLAGLFPSLGGYFIVQMTHLNLLQSFSFIPWGFWLTERIISTGKRKYYFWLTMILAQMILVGHPQTFFNAVAMLGVYALVRSLSIRNLVLIGAVTIGAIFLAAVQVLPLVELAGQSDTIRAAARQRFIHPLPVKHLMTVIHPFIFGDPSRGTYPAYGENWGMFWENMFYVGILPIVAIFVFVFFLVIPGLVRNLFINSIRDKYRFRLKAGMTVGGILAVLVISLVLSLGKYSPLAFLFKLPPLSFTRISSRFLAFSNFSLGILGGYCFAKLIKVGKRGSAAFLAAAILHIAQIGFTFWGYHLWVDGKRWLEPPATVGQLPTGARIVSLGQSDRWNKTFLADGWKGKEEEYYQNRNSLDPNSNMIFGVKQLGVYAQQLPKRQEIIQRNMYGDDILGRNIRDVFGVTDIIDVKNEFEITENKTALPNIRIGENIIKVRDTGEALGIMNQSVFHPQTDVLWESEVLPAADEEAIVVNRSYYPGWRAFLSGKETPIYPVNINQQAVIAPKDMEISQLKFKYDPRSYKIGGAISGVLLAAWLVLLRRFSIQ
jgi:hypothetical protein